MHKVEANVSLYFHIPFCKKKCPYCHFYVIPEKGAHKELLASSLSIEWERQLPLLRDKRIVSIYFGGGTPTLFAPSGIAGLLSLIKNSGLHISPDCEITIEANPENSKQGLFEELAAIGINRLSLGVQSLDDRSLAILERGHGAKQAKAAILEAHSSGIQNISIDLMYDLPDQTEASWKYSLDQIPSLPITHLSLYNLTIEPHTSFYKRRKNLTLPVPATSLKLLNSAISALDNAGFKRYEISAFAKDGKESRHNIGYWTARPFLGFGPSAFSYWEGERFRNIANLQRYARALKHGESPIDFRERLPDPAAIKELLAVRLRLLCGVHLSDFPLASETKSALEKWTKEGCLSFDGSRIRLTERGMLFYDSIAVDLI
jgi:oxygen-independent coproporphyrinogen III oxidase